MTRRPIPLRFFGLFILLAAAGSSRLLLACQDSNEQSPAAQRVWKEVEQIDGKIAEIEKREQAKLAQIRECASGRRRFSCNCRI